LSDFYISDYHRSELSETDSDGQNPVRIQNKLDIRQTSIDIQTYIEADSKGRRLGGSNTPTAMKLVPLNIEVKGRRGKEKEERKNSLSLYWRNR
jgi:hypothetical protein